MLVQSSRQQLEQTLEEALTRLSQRIDIEKLLLVRLHKCMDLLERECRRLTELSGSELLTCNREDGIVTVTAHDRVLTITPAAGIASDARLHRPLGHYCCQVLLFAHVSGQSESTLVTSFRVYADGICSDGDSTWKLEDESFGFAQYLTEVISNELLGCDVYWPEAAELPEFIRTVPVEHMKLDSQALNQTCIGFECSLRKNGKSQ